MISLRSMSIPHFSVCCYKKYSMAAGKREPSARKMRRGKGGGGAARVCCAEPGAVSAARQGVCGEGNRNGLRVKRGAGGEGDTSSAACGRQLPFKGKPEEEAADGYEES